MNIIEIKVELLKEAEYNPRVMNEQEIERLKNSIKKFGIVEPLVVNKDYTIIGGHQRLKALKELEYKEVPCFVLDLSKEDEKILNIALNKITGSWNDEKLIKLIKEISENDEKLKLTGFSEDEARILKMQFDILFGADGNDKQPENRAELEQLFERGERVNVSVERPEMNKTQKKGFYAETMEQYDAIIEFFKTPRQNELDIGKLVELIGEDE
jgi:ParB-like chromosome segregation protein Spo0J